jgi:predicted PurR-regulated permease PerM
MSFWGWLRQTARLWGFLAFIGLILLVFRSVIMPFVLAMLVAYVLAPLVRYLGRLRFGSRTLPRFIWVIAVFAVVLALMGLFFTTFVPRLSGDLKRIVKEAPVFWKKVRESYVPAVASYVQANFGDEMKPDLSALGKPPQPVKAPPKPKLRIKPLENGELELELQHLRLEAAATGEDRWVLRLPADDESARAGPTGQQRFTDSINSYFEGAVARSEKGLRQVLGLGQKFLVMVLSAITTFILVLMISAFLLVDTERILRWFRNLVPKSYFEDFDNVICLIDKGLSGAIRGQAIICVINGVLTWIGLAVFGVKYPLLLALLAGVMSLIPIFGSILSSIPIVLVALASGSTGLDFLKGVLILAWIIAIHLLEANLLNPKIMGQATKIHPVVVIFAVVAGERTYGPIGALLGVPLVSAVQAVFVYLRLKVRGEVDQRGNVVSQPQQGGSS